TSVHIPTSTLILLTQRPPLPTLFPYTTLFRSRAELHQSAPIDIARAISNAVATLPEAPILMRSRTFSPISALCTKLTPSRIGMRSEEHTSELQSHLNLVCRLLLEKKK